MVHRARRRFQVRPFHRFLAAGCAALVLALAILAACPSLHQQLHHESQAEGDDGCAVVLFSHGITSATVAVALAVLAFRWIKTVVAAAGRLDLAAPTFALPPGCGPPQ